jgi:hypothetical protein
MFGVALSLPLTLKFSNLHLTTFFSSILSLFGEQAGVRHTKKRYVKSYLCFPSILSQYSTLPRRNRKAILVIFSSLYSLSQKNGRCCVERFAGMVYDGVNTSLTGVAARNNLLLITLSVFCCAYTEIVVKNSNKNTTRIFNILVIIACKFTADS